MTATYKNELADPKYVLEVTGFYWDNVISRDIGNIVRNVRDMAASRGKPQLDTAMALARLVISDPPASFDFNSVKIYFFDSVLSSIPRTYRYDDVFWCCFLAEMDDSGIPECSIGGPVHRMVYKVHDDFDPGDVSL